jgi:pyrroline-5-carboxylate reductase
VVRIMPNTPAQVGQGASVIVRGRHATAADERLALRMFRSVGLAIAVADESWLDAVTGLSGSGPAYVYCFAEGLVRGGAAAGLPPELAHKLAVQTILGAATLLAESGQSPQELRAAVTSPGGTTLAGLAELERRNFLEAVAAAVVAATERSKELGRG